MVGSSHMLCFVSLWDCCKEELEEKLNKFSPAAAAVILGSLLALKGPDVLRHWYVTERALYYFFVRVAYIIFCLLTSSFLLENRLRNISRHARMYLHRVGSVIHSFGKYLLSNYGQCQMLFPVESKSNKAKICLHGVHNMKGEKSYNRWMHAREFEGAQKKEPLTVAGTGEGFCQVTKEGEGFQMDRVECTFFLLR